MYTSYFALWPVLGICFWCCNTALSQDRTRFAYTDANGRGGSFTRSATGEWIELTGTSEMHTFREIAKKDTHIELFDPKRGGVGVRLARDESFWTHPTLTQGEWRYLWKGHWQASANPVVRTTAQFDAAEQFHFEGVTLSLKLEQFLAKFPKAMKFKSEEISRELQMRSYLIESDKATLIEVRFANQIAYYIGIDYSYIKRGKAGGDQKMVQELIARFGAPEPKEASYERHWKFRLPDRKGCYFIAQHTDRDAFTVEVWDHLTWAIVQAEKKSTGK